MICFILGSELFTYENKFLLRPKFSPTGQIFTLWAPIFIVVINVWPHANWEMVTNNLTAVVDVTLGETLLYIVALTFYNLYFEIILHFCSAVPTYLCWYLRKAPYTTKGAAVSISVSI